MIPDAIRRWLPPICLVALMAAVWVLPYRPDCDSLAHGVDPAIARVDSQCIVLSHYTERLYVIEAAMKQEEQGLIADYHADSDYWRRWYDRVNFYGPETVALADAIRDSILYQRAVSGGHAPSREEVSARLDQDRLRSKTFHDFINLARLAENRDRAGFLKLAAETRNPDIGRILEDLTPFEFMEAMTEDMNGNGWRQLEETFKEGEAYRESFGHQRYWQEILPAKLRREMAISRLEEAVLKASADGPSGPYADVPRLAWLEYQQRAIEEVEIELTRAAPPAVSVDRALFYLAYLVEVLHEERDELSEEYRRWLERREDRRRPTPPPLRPDSE